MKIQIIFFSCFLYVCLGTNQTKDIRDEARLRSYLFDGYDTTSRPVAHNEDTLQVYMHFVPFYLIDLVETSEVLSMYMWIYLKWHAYDLSWDPQDFGNTTFITVKATDIYVPELAVINSVDGSINGNLLTKENRYARLYHDGLWSFTMPGTTNTICKLEMTFFPFDEQVCHVEFDSWTLPLPMLEMVGNLSEVKSTSWRENGQWDLLESWVHVANSQTVTHTFTTLSMVLRLQRKPLFVMVGLFLPVAALSILQSAIFLLPPDTGEKISLGLTILLAQTVFQLVIRDSIPETSDQTPIFVIFLLFCQLISSLEVIFSILVLSYHHRTSSDQAKPGVIDRIILSLLSGEKREEKATTASDLARSAKPEEQTEIDEEKDFDWQNIAIRLDRILFWVFLSLTIILIVTVLIVLPYAGRLRSPDEPLSGYGYYI